MTVSYRTTMADNWHQLRYLFTKAVVGRCLLVFALVTPLVAPLAFHHIALALAHHTPRLQRTAPGSRFDHSMVIASLTMVATAYTTMLFCALIGLYIGTLIAPNATVTVDSEAFSLKNPMTAKIRWKQFSTVAEEADYFCFVGSLQAFLVPKRAFNSSAEADAFFDLASDYWREAKGITLPPPPNTSGVWPPAPSAEDAQRIGDTAKG